MDKIKEAQNLIDAKICLDITGSEYFLIDGTLLGIIRENDFIGHDTDLDIGVFMDKWKLCEFINVVEEMMTRGFILYHSFGIFGQCFEVSWMRDGIKLDFFFYYKHENQYRFNAFLNGGRKLPDDIITYQYPVELLSEFKFIEFYGNEFVIPLRAEEILAHKYGEDWRIPVKKWDWARGPKNIVSIGKF